MKKTILTAALAFLAATALTVDIKTLDGKEYKNATVLSHNDLGVTISYKSADGWDIVKLLHFKNLPDNIRKEYGYNAQKCEQFEKDYQAWIDKQHKLHVKEQHDAKERREMQAKVQKEDAHVDAEVDQILNGTGKKITLNVLYQGEEGAVGWANEHPWGSDNRVSLGKICVMGLHFYNGFVWTGTVYPVGGHVRSHQFDGVQPTYQRANSIWYKYGIEDQNLRVEEKYPCYATRDTAFSIVKRKLLEKEGKSGN